MSRVHQTLVRAAVLGVLCLCLSVRVGGQVGGQLVPQVGTIVGRISNDLLALILRGDVRPVRATLVPMPSADPY